MQKHQVLHQLGERGGRLDREQLPGHTFRTGVYRMYRGVSGGGETFFWLWDDILEVKRGRERLTEREKRVRGYEE